MTTKLIVKFNYLDKAPGRYDRLEEKITVLTLNYEDIVDSKIIEAIKKDLFPYSQEFKSILDITQIK